jgi:hypothetical protein
MSSNYNRSSIKGNSMLPTVHDSQSGTNGGMLPLQELQLLHCKQLYDSKCHQRYSMTQSSAQDYGLQNHLIVRDEECACSNYGGRATVFRRDSVDDVRPVREPKVIPVKHRGMFLLTYQLSSQLLYCKQSFQRQRLSDASAENRDTKTV